MRKLASLLILLSAACSSPVSFSAPVGINLKAKSGDASGGTITEEKEIDSETGNPYGAFTKDATDKLGKAPVRIELESATLLLGGGSTGVTTLDQVFTGEVDVLFVMDTSQNSYNAASISNPTGGGPDDMDVTFDGTAVAPQDSSDLLGGKFKVSLRGTAATSFPAAGANANLQVTLVFDAFAK